LPSITAQGEGADAALEAWLVDAGL